MSRTRRSWQFNDDPTNSSLDCLLNELRPGTLTVFAGAVAMGANCLAMIAQDNFVRRASSRHPAICIDLLDGDNFCAGVILRRATYQQIGKFYADCSMDELNACHNRLEHVPIILNNSLTNLAALEAFIKNIVDKNAGISTIMICGIDALLADKDTVTKLKQLSIDMNIPVVITHILNERVNIRRNHKPLLSDLPNDIRKYADTVILTSRPGYYHSNDHDLNQNMDIWIYNQTTTETKHFILITDLDNATIDWIY